MGIKEKTKNLIKKMPGIETIVHENENLEQQLKSYRNESVSIARKLIDYKLKYKKLRHEKINVVFVCHRPAVWESLHSVYEALESDENFNVSIVAIPNKKELPDLWLNHEIYESEGAEEFWKEYGCIEGYNYENGQWFDLQKLDPDYVFFQTPYNISKPEMYKSWNVARYAKLCYLNYFNPVSYEEIYDECTPPDFLRDISFYFTQNPRDHEYIINRYKNLGFTETNYVMTGYPRYDRLSQIEHYSEIWSDKEHSRFRLVWTPRWTTNEGKCSFFAYKDKLIEFCIERGIELVFRPHPQAFLEWKTTGEFNEEEQLKLRNTFDANEYLHLDESSEYLRMFYSSDCLLTDPSSIVFDYFLTGKPVVFAAGANDEKDFEILKSGLYTTNRWEEIKEILENLIDGKDSLKDRRSELMKSAYYFNENGAGNYIKDILKQDCGDCPL